MDDIRYPTRRQQFPEGATEMFKIIDRLIRQSKSVGHSKSFREMQMAIDEHLFCLIETRGAYKTKLSAIQELQLIEMLSTFFDERKGPSRSTPDSTSPSLPFEWIFCGQENDPALHEARCRILAKTVSLAAQLRCAPLLNDTAAWMQKVCGHFYINLGT